MDIILIAGQIVFGTPLFFDIPTDPSLPVPPYDLGEIEAPPDFTFGQIMGSSDGYTRLLGTLPDGNDVFITTALNNGVVGSSTATVQANIVQILGETAQDLASTYGGQTIQISLFQGTQGITSAPPWIYTGVIFQ